MPRVLSVPKAFVSKFALHIAPIALASVVGGFLFTQSGGPARTPATAAQSSPAGQEMMRLVRDEHDLMADYSRQQTEARQRELNEANRAVAVARADANGAAKVAKSPSRPKQEAVRPETKLAARESVSQPLDLQPELRAPRSPGVIASLTEKAQAAGSMAWSVVIGAARWPGRVWSAGEELIGGRSSEPPVSRFAASM